VSPLWCIRCTKTGLHGFGAPLLQAHHHTWAPMGRFRTVASGQEICLWCLMGTMVQAYKSTCFISNTAASSCVLSCCQSAPQSLLLKTSSAVAQDMGKQHQHHRHTTTHRATPAPPSHNHTQSNPSNTITQPHRATPACKPRATCSTGYAKVLNAVRNTSASCLLGEAPPASSNLFPETFKHHTHHSPRICLARPQPSAAACFSSSIHRCSLTQS